MRGTVGHNALDEDAGCLGVGRILHLAAHYADAEGLLARLVQGHHVNELWERIVHSKLNKNYLQRIVKVRLRQM